MISASSPYNKARALSTWETVEASAFQQENSSHVGGMMTLGHVGVIFFP